MRIVPGLLLLASTITCAESPPATMSDYTTCAVYHRMIAGGFQRRGRDMQVMADLEREKMDLMLRKARELARDESGEEAAEEMFLDEWGFVLAEMTAQIRNYEHLSHLKYRYKDRCTALQQALD